ncbi:hypothetical protein CMV_005634 [Castanea mollissima]|uniref:Uncharacterized protein n=1 Tax=Castanea mollissima TaxID=60419 RepID=A0A8J4RQR9_9ROSI|nr:hypothetical protein CMV_005634 [Castanea mollissima]
MNETTEIPEGQDLEAGQGTTNVHKDKGKPPLPPNAGLVLDPRYKMRYLEYCFGTLYEIQKAVDMAKRIKPVLVDLYNAYAQNQVGSSKASAAAQAQGEKPSGSMEGNDCSVVDAKAMRMIGFKEHLKATPHGETSSNLRSFTPFPTLEAPTPASEHLQLRHFISSAAPVRYKAQPLPVNTTSFLFIFTGFALHAQLQFCRSLPAPTKLRSPIPFSSETQTLPFHYNLTNPHYNLFIKQPQNSKHKLKSKPKEKNNENPEAPSTQRQSAPLARESSQCVMVAVWARFQGQRRCGGRSSG